MIVTDYIQSIDDLVVGDILKQRFGGMNEYYEVVSINKVSTKKHGDERTVYLVRHTKYPLGTENGLREGWCEWKVKGRFKKVEGIYGVEDI